MMEGLDSVKTNQRTEADYTDQWLRLQPKWHLQKKAKEDKNN